MSSRSEVSLLVVAVASIIGVALILAWAMSTRDTPQSAAVPAASSGEAVVPNSIGMEMVPIPGGNFVMGRASSDGQGGAGELPARSVMILPFLMSKQEVTQVQWVAVMGYNPSRYKDPRRPVDQVNWLQVQEFIQRLNRKENTNKYRLPSEAEWEYAARAGSAGVYWFGDGVDALPQYAWFGGQGDAGTAPAGKKKPNPWGLYDIYGNVWEWVADCWHPDYTGAPPDGRVWQGGDCSARVVRGGGWDSPAASLRSSARGSQGVDMNDSATGVRLARFP